MTEETATAQSVELGQTELQTMIQAAIETAMGAVTSRLDDIQKGTLGTRVTDVATGQDVAQDETIKHNVAGLTNAQQAVQGGLHVQIVGIAAGTTAAVLGHLIAGLQSTWNGVNGAKELHEDKRPKV